MSTESHRPKSLWSEKSLTPSVNDYINSYRGEFSNGFDSDFPYQGPASAFFRRIVKIDPYQRDNRFEGKGVGCWVLKRDHTFNELTADLLAAADTLGGEKDAESCSAMPGGLGADTSGIWVALLDGGVGVNVILWEHLNTNRVHARQRTTVRGPRAYRALLELLGFDWINRKLEGETSRPSHTEIKQLVNQSLTEVET